jgi:hypothetical protein
MHLFTLLSYSLRMFIPVVIPEVVLSAHCQTGGDGYDEELVLCLRSIRPIGRIRAGERGESESSKFYSESQYGVSLPPLMVNSGKVYYSHPPDLLKKIAIV